MTRLIDADALIIGDTNVMPCNGLNVDCGFCQFYDKEERFCLLEDWVYNAPTIDAVEVVRCKECRKRKYCEGIYYDFNEMDYCSHGERREP